MGKHALLVFHIAFVLWAHSHEKARTYVNPSKVFVEIVPTKDIFLKNIGLTNLFLIKLVPKIVCFCFNKNRPLIIKGYYIFS